MSLTVVFPFHSFKGLTVHMLKYTGSVQGQCVECPGGYIKIKYLYIWDHEGIPGYSREIYKYRKHDVVRK